jgi:hypothetical protein
MSLVGHYREGKAIMATSDKSQPSTEIQIVTNSGTVLTRNSLESFHAMMLERAQFVSEDRAEEVMLKQALSIIAANETGDATAIMRADMGGTVQARDAGSLEIEINSIDPVISDRDDITNSKGYYVSMNCTVLGGDEEMMTKNGLVLGAEVVLQTGAELFVLKVVGLEKAGHLPYRGRVLSIPTRSGNSVVKLADIPRRVA